MANLQSVTSCREWLGAQGRQDVYLNRHDQAPEIEQNLQELEEALRRLETDISSRLQRLMEEVKADFAKQTQTIEEAKTALEAAFPQLQQSPYKAVNFKRISYSLHQQVNWLSRRLRPRLLRSLDKLAPKYKTLEKPLQELNKFRLHAAKPVDEYLWLLRYRKQRELVPPGASIFELEVAPAIERLCRRPFLSSIRFTWLRMKCQRRYAFYQLPFKSIVLDCLIGGSEINPARLVQRHQATHTELQNRLADAWRSIHYNLETAATELDDLSDSLRNDRPEDIGERPLELSSFVFEALSKCLETFDDVTVTYASFLEAVGAEIAHDHANALDAIKTGIRDSRDFKTRLRWELRLIRKSWRKRIEVVQETTQHNLEAIKQAPVKLGSRASWWYSVLYTFKSQQPAEESLLRLTDLPTEEELLENSKTFPPIYRRLFRNEPLTNREFLVGMEDELELMTKTFERWQSGRASSVAIVGPDGSGKTSLFNCFENELPQDIKVVRAELQHRLITGADVINMLDELLGFEAPSVSAAELINNILREDRQIIMLEHCHQLFLRVVGGREALETFFYILMNTRAHVFWLLSFRLLPWIRLGYLINIERFFTHTIMSEFHEPHEMVAALLLRQRATGQDPVFSADGVASNKVRKLLLKHKVQDAPVQQALADVYFVNLYSISGGNMESALYYWLRSLALDEQGQIVVQPCVKVDSHFIKRLDTISLLSLAEVLAHGSLSSREHSQIFNVEEFRSRVILDSLRQIRLLQGQNQDKHGQPQFYSVNVLFFEQVHTVLSTMHIIY
jgi:hypothetical protein